MFRKIFSLSFLSFHISFGKKDIEEEFQQFAKDQFLKLRQKGLSIPITAG